MRHYNLSVHFHVILLATLHQVAITPACLDICPLIVSVEEKESAQEFQLFFSSVDMEGNQTHFKEFSDSDIMAFLPCFFFYHGFFTTFTRGLIAKKINGRVIK